MIAYRIENTKSKQGPYNHGNAGTDGLGRRLQRAHDGDPDRPIVSWGIISEGRVCACPSLDGLFDWFDGWMGEVMSHPGNTIAVYWVDDDQVKWCPSKLQFTFPQTQATRLE